MGLRQMAPTVNKVLDVPTGFWVVHWEAQLLEHISKVNFAQCRKSKGKRNGFSKLLIFPNKPTS